MLAEKIKTDKTKKVEHMLPVGNITKKKSDQQTKLSGAVVPPTTCPAYVPAG
jgi:predicted component of type VI protein secretion system